MPPPGDAESLGVVCGDLHVLALRVHVPGRASDVSREGACSSLPWERMESGGQEAPKGILK